MAESFLMTFELTDLAGGYSECQRLQKMKDIGESKL